LHQRVPYIVGSQDMVEKCRNFGFWGIKNDKSKQDGGKSRDYYLFFALLFYE
jgi:hypothetical protein